MARGLAAVLSGPDLTVVVNVGDDDRMYGLHVSADLDTVLYTLAGMEGRHGWGIDGDSHRVMAALQAIGVDTTFRVGDRDLAHCLWRTGRLDAGERLSVCTAELAASLGVMTRVLPASDDPVRTRVRISTEEWLAFQEYFVLRGHGDEVSAVEYSGADEAAPSPGVLEAIAEASIVIIAPSNPPLSIWPILAVPGIRSALAARDRVVAVSPLFSGKALKGPADRVMASLGLPPGNAGVAAAYEGLITDLVVDIGDEGDVTALEGDIRVHAVDTRIGDAAAGRRFASWLLENVA
jgi:LPPG:FO 2-phospho-L-lactate transferase